MVGVVKALVDATNELNKNNAEYVQVAVKGTGASVDVVKEAIPRGRLDYKLYEKEAKALLNLIDEAKMTQTDTSGAVDRQFDYSLLTEATGQSKRQLGGE